MSIRFLLAVFVFEATWSFGCSSNGKDCDPGQIKQNNVCVAAPADGGSGGVGGAGGNEGFGGATSDDAAAGDAQVTGMNDGNNAAFGRACMTSGISPECADPAPYCAIQPGTTSGYCTATDCKGDASKCPATWTCFDVGVINFCLKP